MVSLENLSFSRYEGRLECAENIGSDCKRGTAAGRLWEAYQLTEIMVFAGDICTDEPRMCSFQAAMSCISYLGQTVSTYDYLSVDNGPVCRYGYPLVQHFQVHRSLMPQQKGGGGGHAPAR